MSFGLGRGRELDGGRVGLTMDDLPPLPDALFAAPLGPDGEPEESVRRSAWFDPRQWFEHPELAFELEIGSGKGTFIVEEAARRPETNFLGVEWAKEFYLYAADRCRRRGLANARLLHADATELLHWRIPDAIVRTIHLYFSDPWPKARHHKRRVVNDRFLADARRVLVPGGELRIVTDHDEYWQWMEEHFARWCAPTGPDATGRMIPALFERITFEAGHRPIGAAEGELVGTNFERKYAREGRPFHSAVLRKPDRSGAEGTAP